jgi:hypothetical protein
MTQQTNARTPLEHAAQLRKASDSFMSKLDRLHELESRKRELPPTHPEFVRLAREVEDLARSLLYSGGEQVELAERVHHDAKAGDGVLDLPIRETPPKRDAVAVLAEWRAAERVLAAARLDSEAEHQAQADVQRLRDEYRRITAPIPGDNGS